MRSITLPKILLQLFFCAIFFSTPIFSSTLKNTTFDNPKLLSLSTGIFNIVKDPVHPMIQLEYRSTLKNFKKARPLCGFFVTEQGVTYLYGGIGYDIFFGKNVVFMPSFAPGFYYHGKGRKLHFPLEFRSCGELAYVFKNKSRFGAQFYHISNASLGKRNPGVEALLFTYSFAL
jgi:lipid A 3-O-deacylase